MSRHDQEYVRAFESLDPELREQMRQAGIVGPDFVCDSGFRHNHANHDMGDVHQPFAGLDTDEKVCEVVRRIVGELLCQSNPALAIECFSIVTGIGYLGDSMTEIAKRHRVTRAAVSKRCVELSESLGLDPSRSMRKPASLKRHVDRKPESVHPHVNRVVSLFSRLRRSGWLRSQSPEQLRRMMVDLDPVVAIRNELEAMANDKK